MFISIQFIIIFILLSIAFSQVNPNIQPATFYNYVPGTYVSPSPAPQSLTGSSAGPPPPSSPSLTSVSPAVTAASNPSAANPSSTSSDSISPNTNTLSNVLKNGALTTNPTASPYLNTGYYDYTTANTAFTAVSHLGGHCNGQNIISFVAFRQYSTQFYMTPNLYFLSLLLNSSPNQQQLFTAIQNIDCTWSFKTSDGMYLSLNTAFSYLTLSATLSVGQRFYIERKQDWIYIESANSYRYFWTATNGIVLTNMNSASRFVMEIWPDLNVGWN